MGHSSAALALAADSTGAPHRRDPTLKDGKEDEAHGCQRRASSGGVGM
jgi:hypothetical protein